MQDIKLLYHNEDIPISYRMNTERILELFSNLKTHFIMAKISFSPDKTSLSKIQT